MNRLLIAVAIILATALSAHAAGKHYRRAPSNGVTVWNRDSPDPNVGWHTEHGFRVCRHDCDNPEIPGSGARCRNVTFMGMAMHECVTGHW